MRFIDEAIIEVAAGDGGNGCMSFLRLKYLPKGGPNGGDGGRGGDVVLRANAKKTTLADHSYLRHFRAGRGSHGMGSDKNGRAGESKIVEVPVGTVVRDEATGEVVADLLTDGQTVVAARGGDGGLGNKHFATSTNRAPRKATPGWPGEHRTLRLELKLLADVGLIGKPNAGKSSLVAALSRARPKVADYPFTTLTPHLGTVVLPAGESFVVADIPGLVAGAHQGAGLGLRFLKHVERTRLFVYVLDLAGDDPPGDLLTLREELAAYQAGLGGRAALVAANKIDLPEAEANLAALGEAAAKLGLAVYPLSAREGTGVPALVEALAARLAAPAPAAEPAEGE